MISSFAKETGLHIMKESSYGIYRAYSTSPRLLESFISSTRSKKVLAKLWQKKPCLAPGYKRRANSRPDPPFRYFSNARAFCFKANARTVSIRHGSMFCGVRASPLIMFRQMRREIAGYAGVVQRLISLAYKDINVVKVSHLGSCQDVAFRTRKRR